ncbi:MAG: BBE domain-containing protein, partial [Steroidobacteraceae bacterium]
PAGDKLVGMDVCYSGPIEAAERVLAPYRKLGKPLRDELGPMKYTQLQTKDDARARIGRHYYTKSGFVKQLDGKLIATIVDIYAESTVPAARIAIPAFGGAMNRVAPDATAFWHRNAAFNVIVQASSDDGSGDAPIMEWVKARWPAIEPSTIGFYANTNLSDAPADRILGVYGGNYERLVALKKKHDPTNLFRLNANVKPS